MVTNCKEQDKMMRSIEIRRQRVIADIVQNKNNQSAKIMYDIMTQLLIWSIN